MCIRFRIAALTSALLLLLGVAACEGPRGGGPDAIAIPSKSIYATSGQKGLLRLDDKLNKVGEWHWEAIRKGVSGGGPNVLMVAADDTLQLILLCRDDP